MSRDLTTGRPSCCCTPSSAWQSYSRVLGSLAKRFHVFVIDFPGHGRTQSAATSYHVHTLSSEVAEFVTDVVAEPVIVSGHSSGGLIAAQLAADEPEQARAGLFEDPPFFSTDPDRAPRTFNYIDLATPAHRFLHQDAEEDFTSYYLANNGWIGYLGGGRDPLVARGQAYRRAHLDRPLTLRFLPPSINETWRYLHTFDPRFADAFHNFTWQEGFDQQSVLRRVGQPTILIHANWRMSEAGILEGEMTEEDAATAGGPAHRWSHRACRHRPRIPLRRSQEVQTADG